MHFLTAGKVIGRREKGLAIGVGVCRMNISYIGERRGRRGKGVQGGEKNGRT